MPRSTHGEFDQVVEVSRFFFRDQAMAGFKLPKQDLKSDQGADVSYNGSVRIDLRDVWFGDAAETFNATTGKWDATTQSAAWNAVVFGIDISGDLNIEAFGDFHVPDTPAARLLRVHVAAIILAPLGIEAASVRSARDEEFPNRKSPCAVIKMPTSTFFYNVTVDMAAVRSSPFVKWATDAINTLKTQLGKDLGDPEIVVVQRLKEELHKAVVDALRVKLAEIVDWHLDKAGRLGVVTTTPEMGVTDLVVTTTFTSIRVFMQTTGAGGQAQFATRSQLRPSTAPSPGSAGQPADSMVITVNGRALLEQLRGPLAQALGLAESDFLTDEPCTVVGPVATTLGDGRNKVQFLQAGVDEASTLIVWVFLRAPGPFGPVDIEIELPITFSAIRAVRGTSQVILLEQHVGAARYAASSPSSALADFAIEAITDHRLANVLLGPWALAPQVLPVPQGMYAQPNDPGSVSLNQAGAPRYPRTWPGYRLFGAGFGEAIIHGVPTVKPGRFREHDLVLRLDIDPSAYPKNLTVSCVTPDSSDPLERIDGVGGTFTRIGTGTGPEDWAMSIDTAIDWLSSGMALKLADGTAVLLGREPKDYPPANPDPGTLPYLRTASDTATSNNLAKLPACIMTMTLLSPTYGHWHDVVIPLGDNGEDIVNEGKELGPDCVVSAVVLELLDKAGNVLATNTFGGTTAKTGSPPMTAGARIVSDPTGTRSLAVRVAWWFEAYTMVGYRLRYTVAGMMCP